MSRFRARFSCKMCLQSSSRRFWIGCIAAESIATWTRMLGSCLECAVCWRCFAVGVCDSSICLQPPGPPTSVDCKRGQRKGATSKNVKNRQKVSKSFSTLLDNFRAGQKTSKIVKKCQKVFRHFSTIFARHHFSGPFWGALTVWGDGGIASLCCESVSSSPLKTLRLQSRGPHTDHLLRASGKWAPKKNGPAKGRNRPKFHFEPFSAHFSHFQGHFQKNPRAHKNKIGTPPPPKKNPKYPPHPKRGILWAWVFPAERAHFSRAPIKLAQPFPAPELRAKTLRTRGFSGPFFPPFSR